MSDQIRHCIYNSDSTVAEDQTIAGWTPDAVAATHKANDARASFIALGYSIY